MAEMKDSGIEWIGMIPKNWNADKIKYHLKRNEPKNPGNVEVLSVYREYGVIPKNSRDDNHNITSEDTSKYKYVKKGDLVINKMKAWQGSMGVSEYEGIVSPAYFIYNFTDNYLDKKYFHFLIRNCYKDEFRRISGGIREGQWDLSADLFADELVLVPPIKEQIKIVEFLNTKCAEIDTLYSDIEKQIDILEEYKKSIITEAVTKGLDPDVEMKDSGIEWIGMIPKNWNISRLKYELETSMKYGASEAGVEYSDDLPRYIRITDITNNNRLKTGGKLSLTEKQANGYMLEKDTVLFARSGGTVGKTFLYKPEYGKAAFAGYLISAIPDKEKMQAEWLYYFSLSNAYWDWVNQIFTQATIQNIGADKYSNLPIPIPSINIQNAIVNYLNKKCAEIDYIITDKKKQLETLEQYKKSLIYEYVTGKKEVK
ncbi:restriction endonuclease subunit S [Eshraghiella crossota]|uniref:restriction endonuclease subunit S n=1 Tax=Eshraghiella crossota TaxID=45851 RepID=UPI003FD7CA95